jgi:dTDP-4-dehydrorhamnose 3,5-epimerase
MEDDTEILYFASEFYSPEHARGCRFDDPAIAIAWPGEVAVVSDQDRNWPLLAQ